MKSNLIEGFRIEELGRLVSQLCISFTAFIPKIKNDFDASPQFMNFWEKFSKDLNWFSVNGNSADKAITPENKVAVARIVEKSLKAIGKKGAAVLLRGGSAKAWGLPLFEIWSGPSPNAFGVLRVSLSLDDFEATATLSDFLSEMASGFPLASAHCGFSIFWNQLNFNDRNRLKEPLRDWALKYSGLMNSFAASGTVPAAHGLVDIGWITILGTECAAVARELDIRDRLAELQESSGVETKDLHDGSILIRSAPTPGLLISPETRDVENRYRIGEILRPLWREALNGRQVVPGFNDPQYVEQARWANRFFLAVPPPLSA